MLLARRTLKSACLVVGLYIGEVVDIRLFYIRKSKEEQK